MKRAIAYLLIAICVFALVSCESCDKYDEDYVYDGKSLVGKWVDSSINENSYDVYHFVDNTRVILTTNCYGIELKRLEGTYSVTDNNKIHIKSNFGNEYVRFSITDEGELVLKTLNDMNIPEETERVMIRYNLTYNQSNERLLGTWASVDNPNERYIFNEDYTGKVIGEAQSGDIAEYKFYYSTKANKLYIIVEYTIGYQEKVKEVEVSIHNDTLILRGYDEKKFPIDITLKKVS
jgi:hypothetical protein